MCEGMKEGGNWVCEGMREGGNWVCEGMEEGGNGRERVRERERTRERELKKGWEREGGGGVGRKESMRVEGGGRGGERA